MNNQLHRVVITCEFNDNYMSNLVPKSQRKPYNLLIEVNSTTTVHHNMNKSLNSIKTKRQRKPNCGNYSCQYPQVNFMFKKPTF